MLVVDECENGKVEHVFKSLILGAKLPGFASDSPLYSSATVKKTFFVFFLGLRLIQLF